MLGSIGVYHRRQRAPGQHELATVEGLARVAAIAIERHQADEALRQTQKLESLGTLAGGIAHDFNNILGAILGYGEMALRDAPRGSRLRRDLDSILAAGERGRALVDRILAFSRSGLGERVAVNRPVRRQRGAGAGGRAVAREHPHCHRAACRARRHAG